jgi:hypothetical protein
VPGVSSWFTLVATSPIDELRPKLWRSRSAAKLVSGATFTVSSGGNGVPPRLITRSSLEVTASTAPIDRRLPSEPVSFPAARIWPFGAGWTSWTSALLVTQ